MEHAQPLSRPFPWRLTTLVACAVVLAILGALVLTHGSGQTRPEAVSRHAPKGPALPPLRPRGRISVLVLNGNGIGGAAGGLASALLARGYRHAVPTDAPNLDYARSLVLFRPGWQREAERLGRDARIATVTPLDGRVAPPYARVPLVVILGAN
ncbi:MAG TPA: LytR C-terminal domain-containing protein [Gaiellaceae bacterium]|nr:LytR C-terminal domain-containing protein [Gaiellaceae bacterium]